MSNGLVDCALTFFCLVSDVAELGVDKLAVLYELACLEFFGYFLGVGAGFVYLALEVVDQIH